MKNVEINYTLSAKGQKEAAMSEKNAEHWQKIVVDDPENRLADYVSIDNKGAITLMSPDQGNVMLNYSGEYYLCENKQAPIFDFPLTPENAIDNILAAIAKAANEKNAKKIEVEAKNKAQKESKRKEDERKKEVAQKNHNALVSRTKEAIERGMEELIRNVDERFIYGDSESSWKSRAGKFPEADEFIAMIERAHTEKKHRAEEKENAKKQQISDYVAAKGTDNQKKRLSVGLLPDDEITDLIRSEAFAPLADFDRYEKLTASDIDCSCGEYDDKKVIFDVYDATSATAEQFDLMEKIKTLMPEAKTTLRVHTAYCERCDGDDDADENGLVDRFSVIVGITVGNFYFTREYAA